MTVIANEFTQPSLSLFTVKGTRLATGDELILNKPTHPGSDFNTGAIYIEPAHTTYRLQHDAAQDRFYREPIQHHTIRYTDGVAAGLIDTVPEETLIEYVTPDGYVGEL